MDELTEHEINHSPGSISPLPPVLRHGLAAVATFGLLSFLTSLALVVLLTYKLVSWQIRPAQPKKDIPERPESPPCFDHNGFLVPARGASPLREDSQPEEPETFWERLKKEPPNQFLVLILNLFLADIQQALAFLLNLDWVVRDGIQIGTPTCWLQGFFISNGDLASSIFITGIAVHTYLGVVKGYRLPTAAFYWAIGGMWGFVYMCGFLAIIISNSRPEYGGPFVRAGAWCWWHPVHQDLRLYLHYLWIFISLASTSVIYTLIFFHLRDLKKNGGRPRPNVSNSLPDSASASTRSLSRSSSRAKHYPNPDPNSYPKPPGSPTTSFASSLNKDLPPIPDSARQQTFLLYPLIYLICTVPLAAGRIASMAGNEVSVGYFCFAGAAIACNGLLDAVLYTYTRRAIVFSDERPGQDTGIDTFAFMRTPPSRKFGNVVIVSGGQANNGGKRKGKWRGAGERAAGLGLGLSRLKGGMGGANASEESFRGFGMGQGEVLGMAIQCETTTTVSVEYDDGARGRTLA